MRKLIIFALGVGVGFAGSNAFASDTSPLEDTHCLALNMYHESKWEPIKGKIAVSYVVMNRVRSDMFPDSVCDVIFQGPRITSWKNKNVQIPVKNMCQFSWYCDGKSDEPKDVAKYEECFKIATKVLSEYGTDKENDPTNGSLWYHADYVDPDWNDIYYKEATIGRHIFYSKNGRKTP